MNTKYPMPHKLDTPEIRGTFDLWLQYQESKGFGRNEIERDAILMLWAGEDPETFREALLESISNGWKNLRLGRGVGIKVEPWGRGRPTEPIRQTLEIKNPGMGEVIRLVANKRSMK